MVMTVNYCFLGYLASAELFCYTESIASVWVKNKRNSVQNKADVSVTRT